jgi:prolyl-tRNA editing enzyme YbaK/EbsC (Cys-tRNA(Pro) deacylase)
VTAAGDASPPELGLLQLFDAADRPDLVADTVRAALGSLDGTAGRIWVTPIDPELSDTAVFCERYQISMAASANCVVMSGKRSGEQRWAAAVILATTRADVNTVVRKRLDVRKISFAPMDDAVSRTGMEYGGITPIGLPADWPILIDSRVTKAGPVVIGAGIRGAKIVIEGSRLAGLPGAEVVEGLAV